MFVVRVCLHMERACVATRTAAREARDDQRKSPWDAANTDVFARSATRRAAVLVATPNQKIHITGMPEIARMAASLVTCPPRGLPAGRLARPNGAPHFLPAPR
ncbi:hypothetical protein L810_1490 [Burkholderia sp. AU4i]|nr:hypothetical protein L810_1490 [Burkholderia sp. AU4i]MDW9226173.1 hypothetical protein [Burkholderia cepacia]